MCRRVGGTKGGHGKGRGLHFSLQGRNGPFVHNRIVSADKRVGFVSGRTPHIVLRGHWCNIIVLNVHVPSEEKSDNSEGSF